MRLLGEFKGIGTNSDQAATRLMCFQPVCSRTFATARADAIAISKENRCDFDADRNTRPKVNENYLMRIVLGQGE